MKANLASFVGATLLLWAVCSLAAWSIHGEVGLLYTGVACLLCLIPMLGTLVWKHLVQGGSTEAKLAAAMGGTGVRMFVVMLGGVALYMNVPALNEVPFMLWLIVFYLATLALEVTVAVRAIMGEADREAAGTATPSKVR